MTTDYTDNTDSIVVVRNASGSWIAILTIIVFLSNPSQAAEPEWGNLEATFVFEGERPTPHELKVDKDRAVCAKEKLFDESLLVSPENKEVANVVVWLEYEDGTSLPDEHPDYAKAAKDEVKLRIDKCRFEPHVSLLRTTQTLAIHYEDPIGHNADVRVMENSHFGRAIPAGSMHNETFKNPEKIPVPVNCSIHPWMYGHVLIQDHPYMAVSGTTGELQIRNLPVGKWTFIAWHERAGWLRRVSREGRPEAWAKGRFQVEIKPGDNDLGQIGLSADLFKPK
jgi:hypothetical protein